MLHCHRVFHRLLLTSDVYSRSQVFHFRHAIPTNGLFVRSSNNEAWKHCLRWAVIPLRFTTEILSDLALRGSPCFLAALCPW